MSKVNVSIVALAEPILVGGKNLGGTIEKKKLTGISLVYDKAEKELTIVWNGDTAVVPVTNIKKYHPEVEAVTKDVVAKETFFNVPKGKIKAQVGGPTHHVFEGAVPEK